MSYVRSLLYGCVVTVAVIILFSLFFAIYMRFSSMSETTITYVTLILGNIALLCGGFIAGWKGKKRGWLLGLLTGVGFSLIIFLYQSLTSSFSFSLHQLMFHSSYLLFSIFGSIIGVNVWRGNDR